MIAGRSRRWDRPGKYHWTTARVITRSDVPSLDAFPVASWAAGHQNDPRYLPHLMVLSNRDTEHKSEKYAQRRESARASTISWEEFFLWCEKLGLELVEDTNGRFHVRRLRGLSNAEAIRRSHWDGPDPEWA